MNLPPQFAAIGKFLSREFEAIVSQLDKVHAALKEFGEVMHAREEVENEKGKFASEFRAVVSFDDETATKSKADADRQYRIQRSIRNWTSAAVLAASLYAGISFLMWCEMKKATDAAVLSAKAAAGQLEELRKQQPRPWLGLSSSVAATRGPVWRFISDDPRRGAGAINFGFGMDGEYQVSNYGSVPAFDVNANLAIFIPESTEQGSNRPDRKNFFCFEGPTKNKEGQIIFPGHEARFAFGQDVARVASGIREVGRVWLLECISYHDQWGATHHTRFWLRSTYQMGAQWMHLTPSFRYMPITGFESWGAQAD